MIPHFYTTISGWFDFERDYDFFLEQAQDGDHFVEVGSWKGKSSAYMATIIANSGKHIQFDCVDTWQGSQEHQLGQPFQDQDVIMNQLRRVFDMNMRPVQDYYRAREMTSIQAAKLYPDGSLTMVFLDAAHDYDSIRQDILAWLPKIKSKGWMGGHDYTWNEGIRRACKELLPTHTHDPSWNDQLQQYDPSKEHLGVSWRWQKP